MPAADHFYTSRSCELELVTSVAQAPLGGSTVDIVTFVGRDIAASVSISNSLYRSRQNSSGASWYVTGFSRRYDRLFIPSRTSTRENRFGSSAEATSASTWLRIPVLSTLIAEDAFLERNHLAAAIT